MKNIDLFTIDKIDYDAVSCGEIFNEDCFVTMSSMKDKVSMIITSPPYNTTPDRGMGDWALSTHNCRYDGYSDYLPHSEYREWTVKLFNNFDKVLKENGCIAYNFSYGSNESSSAADMIDILHAITNNTSFTLVDIIAWKKQSAMPNSMSSNKCTRIIEYVYIFARKNEVNTFISNKVETSVRPNGQQMYSSMLNFIEAPNNDGSCPINKATYSSKLVFNLMSMYAGEESGIIYDPFMGSGTTAVGVIQFNREYNRNYTYLGSELSSNQVEYATNRINDYLLS